MATRTRGTSDTFIQRSSSVRAIQKAIYHDVEGAGRSRVLRPFFRLTARAEAWIAREIETRIDQRLRGV